MSGRNALPNRRTAENFDIRFQGATVKVTLGAALPGGPVREVFLATHKHGTALDTAARDTAMLLSWLLQYGCPLERHAPALTRDENGTPEGLAGMIADELVRSGAGAPNPWLKTMAEADGPADRACVLLTAPVSVLLAHREDFDRACRVTDFEPGRRYLAGLDAAIGKPRIRGLLNDNGFARAQAELLVIADGGVHDWAQWQTDMGDDR